MSTLLTHHMYVYILYTARILRSSEVYIKSNSMLLYATWEIQTIRNLCIHTRSHYIIYMVLWAFARVLREISCRSESNRERERADKLHWRARLWSYRRVCIVICTYVMFLLYICLLFYSVVHRESFVDDGIIDLFYRKNWFIFLLIKLAPLLGFIY